MAGDLTVANLNGVPPVQLSTDEIVQSDGSHIKNQCTAWVKFDGTATPPTILESFNVSDVVRSATGRFSIEFTIPMDNTNYTFNGSGRALVDVGIIGARAYNIPSTIGSISFVTLSQAGAPLNCAESSVQIFGGRN